MTFLTFILSAAVVFLILVLIRAFWIELATVGLILYVTGQLAFISFCSAVLWAIFVTKSAAGWGWTFLFFFFTYGGIALVCGLIAMDIFEMIGKSLTNFFKKIK